ncbi:hypothetical protein AXX17_AT2G06390 [Arabidopsis thaliana]|uniref:Transposase Tnp1/En/Spm-like domain-containing protein n=1 Tax=Arabidopsis thaliana TaxID=3702 RepID=A0A178VUM8_ARATH|nr:hypothetical protein AXX17_AT2G06390 [Arabidopsis thaliana]
MRTRGGLVRPSERQRGLETRQITKWPKTMKTKKTKIAELMIDVQEDNLEILEEDVAVEKEVVEEDVAEKEDEAKSNDREEDSQHTDAGTEMNSSSEFQTSQSANPVKKRRGPTKMRKVAKDPQEKVEVYFTELGEHVGSGSVTLSSFLGAIVREHVPIQSHDSQMDSTLGDNIREDVVSQVLEKDKSGRVKGLGRGITATKLAFNQARDSRLEELQNEVEDLKNIVRDMAGKNKNSTWTSHSEVSDVSKGVRCRIPLGEYGAAVIVTSVSVPEASVWRPTPDVFLLQQALGVKIAWPVDKVTLDAGLESQNDSETANGGKDTGVDDGQLGRCRVLDWKMDEVIAEGVICSSNKVELINNIPLVQVTQPAQLKDDLNEAESHLLRVQVTPQEQVKEQRKSAFCWPVTTPAAKLQKAEYAPLTQLLLSITSH